MRVFFAIPITNPLWLQIKDELLLWQSHYQHLPIRWVKRDNLHITLQFINTLDANVLPNLLINATKNIATVEPFKISLEQVIIFPSAFNPRAIALQVIPNEKLHTLAIRLADAMSLNNIAADKRPFHAHMTIGRIQQTKKFPYDSSLNTIYGEQLVNSVVLYCSEPSSSGSAYIPIAHIPLANGI